MSAREGLIARMREAARAEYRRRMDDLASDGMHRGIPVTSFAVYPLPAPPKPWTPAQVAYLAIREAEILAAADADDPIPHDPIPHVWRLAAAPIRHPFYRGDAR